MIIDTNFFTIISKNKIDIFKEIRDLVPGKYRTIISSRILSELEKLSKQNKDAKFALALVKNKIKNKRIKMIKNDEYPDYWIIDFSKKHKTIVCTNDADLRKSLKKIGAKVISLRANKKLAYV